MKFCLSIPDLFIDVAKNLPTETVDKFVGICVLSVHNFCVNDLIDLHSSIHVKQFCYIYFQSSCVEVVMAVAPACRI